MEEHLFDAEASATPEAVPNDRRWHDLIMSSISGSTPSSSSEPSIDEKVRAWAERSGRALELRVARACMAQGATVRPSFPYLDPLTQLVREGDVQAEWSWKHPLQDSYNCSLLAIIECKSGSGKPWVAFYPSGHQRLGLDSLRNWVARSWAPSEEIAAHVASRWIGSPPFDDANPATHIVAANLAESSRKHDAADNDKNDAWDAVRQVLSQTEGVHRRYTPRTPEGEERGVFIVAAVVTAAPLFTCRLGDDGSIKVDPVDSLTVMGHGPEGERQRVHVVRESELPRFAGDLRRSAANANGDGFAG